jgi:hypothetical protein
VCVTFFILAPKNKCDEKIRKLLRWQLSQTSREPSVEVGKHNNSRPFKQIGDKIDFSIERPRLLNIL